MSVATFSIKSASCETTRTVVSFRLVRYCTSHATAVTSRLHAVVFVGHQAGVATGWRDKNRNPRTQIHNSQRRMYSKNVTLLVGKNTTPVLTSGAQGVGEAVNDTNPRPEVKAQVKGRGRYGSMSQTYWFVGSSNSLHGIQSHRAPN
jgi:hypothetical protein